MIQAQEIPSSIQAHFGIKLLTAPDARNSSYKTPYALCGFAPDCAPRTPLMAALCGIGEHAQQMFVLGQELSCRDLELDGLSWRYRNWTDEDEDGTADVVDWDHV